MCAWCLVQSPCISVSPLSLSFSPSLTVSVIFSGVEVERMYAYCVWKETFNHHGLYFIQGLRLGALRTCTHTQTWKFNGILSITIANSCFVCFATINILHFVCVLRHSFLHRMVGQPLTLLLTVTTLMWLKFFLLLVHSMG